MKRSIMFILLCCFTFALTTAAFSQLYFEDNFDNPSKSEEKWASLWGTWEFKNKEYHQLLDDANCISIVTDDYWNEDWVEYTYEVSANKISGAEAFLIMFRLQGEMNPRGKSLRNIPPSMKGKELFEYWWNLGGWGNSVSRIEAWNGAAYKQAGDSNHTFNTDTWYNIKIVNTPTSYTLILDDEEVHKISDSDKGGVGRIGLGTWHTLAKYKDVVVYGPDGPLPVDPKGKVATTWGFLKAGR